ncbi:ETC complex I subunit conserved region-domain-containing protein [Spinellus fusiger]|nr:ETC complex I subunit conserved region-domain-containing protein [Spinellus fusiger]
MLFSRPLFQAVTKVSTGIAGIPVHPHPRPHLIQIYTITLEALARLPPTAVYRQSTEALTQQRLSVVQSTEEVAVIEAQLNAGQIEEVIIQAEEELTLVGNMEQWKPWESLETAIPKGQWDYISNYKS